MVKRYAFTLIEVILALIIISITVLSVPMIIQVNAASTQGSVTQEAVFAASAKLLQTLSFPWDENAVNPALAAEGADTLAGVVNIPANGDTATSLAVDRLGFISRQTRRDNLGVFVNTTNIGDDNANPLVRGIDDFNNDVSTTNNAVTTAGSVIDVAASYKDNYTITTTVGYVNDHLGTAGNIDYNTSNPLAANSFVLSNAVTANPTNLRLVRIDITGRDEDNDGNPDLLTSLFAYAANIGETRPYKRSY